MTTPTCRNRFACVGAASGISIRSSATSSGLPNETGAGMTDDSDDTENVVLLSDVRRAKSADKSNTDQPKAKQSDVLIGLVEFTELFHTSDGVGFADIVVDGHRETWPIRSKGFRRWLARLYFEVTKSAPSSQALQSALDVIGARAHFDSPTRDVHL